MLLRMPHPAAGTHLAQVGAQLHRHLLGLVAHARLRGAGAGEVDVLHIMGAGQSLQYMRLPAACSRAATRLPQTHLSVAKQGGQRLHDGLGVHGLGAKRAAAIRAAVPG